MAVAERKQILNVLNALVTKGITNKYGRILDKGRIILNDIFNNNLVGWTNLFYTDNQVSPIDSPQTSIHLWTVEVEEELSDQYNWAYFIDNETKHEITEEILKLFAKTFNIEDALVDNDVILDDDDDFIV